MSSVIERIFDKISPEPNSGCWFWEGYTYNGHPKVWLGKKQVYAKTVLFQHLGINAPNGYLKPTCLHRECLNPTHWKLAKSLIMERLMRRVFISRSECWEVGKRNRYAPIRMEDGRLKSAHVVSYEAHNGPVPEGLIVRHKCDNMKCINPDHLLVGTHADNSRDAVERNRTAKGERSGVSKLTDDDVLQMRERHKNGASAYRLAKEFGVSHSNAHRIVTGNTWKHLWP